MMCSNYRTSAMTGWHLWSSWILYYWLTKAASWWCLLLRSCTVLLSGT